MDSIINMIGNVDFPIAMCICMWRFFIKEYGKKDKDHD